MRVAELDEAGGLVAGVGIDRTAEMVVVVGHHADRASFDACQRRDATRPPAASQLHHRIHIAELVDDVAHVVGPQAILGHQVPQFALVVALPLVDSALEVRQVLLGGHDRLGLVFHQHIDHAVGPLHVDRADFLGTEHAQAAAFDHGGAADADVRALGRDDHVAAAQQHRVARKAATVGDAHERHQAAELGEEGEGPAVQPRAADAVGIARPAAATLGQQHHRQAVVLGDLEHAVLLAVVVPALGARQHHVVVGHHHGLRLLGAEEVAVDAGHARHHAVALGVGDQVLHRAAAALRSHHQRAVLHERARIDEVGHVLARRAVAPTVTLGNSVGPVLVEAEAATVEHFGQIGPDVVEIDRGGCFGELHGNLGLLDEQQRVPLVHRVTGRHAQHPHDARDRGGHDVLHLHRFHHRDLLALGDGIAFGDSE